MLRACEEQVEELVKEQVKYQTCKGNYMNLPILKKHSAPT